MLQTPLEQQSCACCFGLAVLLFIVLRIQQLILQNIFLLGDVLIFAQAEKPVKQQMYKANVKAIVFIL